MSTEPNSQPLPLLNPVKKVSIAGQEIEIRELNWQRAIEFMGMLSRHASSFLDDAGRVRWEIQRLTSLITGAGDLSEFLVVHSTGQTPEWLRGLSFVHGLELLDHALEVNLSPKILDLAKKTAARFALAAGGRAAATPPRTIPPSPESSTSSSGRTGASPK